MMDKLKFYRYAAIGLLVLNLAILAFFFLYLPLAGKPHQRPQPTHLELEFDEQQMEAFHGLAESHQTMMRRIDRQQKDLLAEYFNSLAQNKSDSVATVPPGYIKLEEEKISGTYNHFLELKALLQPEQQQNFPRFVDRTLKNILRRGRNQPSRPPNRKDQYR